MKCADVGWNDGQSTGSQWARATEEKNAARAAAKCYMDELEEHFENGSWNGEAVKITLEKLSLIVGEEIARDFWNDLLECEGESDDEEVSVDPGPTGLIKTLAKSGIQAAEGGGWEVKAPHAHDSRCDELAQLVGDKGAASAAVSIREMVLRKGIVNE